MSVAELEARLADRENQPLILDVREPWECAICSLPDARQIPMRQIPGRLQELDKDAEIVVLCHHGVRSYQVAYYLQHQGFNKLHNLQGGIDAWARQIDPAMPKY